MEEVLSLKKLHATIQLLKNCAKKKHKNMKRSYKIYGQISTDFYRKNMAALLQKNNTYF